MPESFIPLSVPNLNGRELELVSDAIRTGWVSTAGKYVADFEGALAQYVHADKAVSCQSGTAGLHISLLLCGVKAMDYVLVPTLTFIAAVNPVRYIGADPIFMDCDDSLCLDPDKLEKFCQEECYMQNDQLYHATSKRRIPALVVVHVFGNMANMPRIIDIAQRYNLKVVEDATEALGTHYKKDHPIFPGRFAGTMGDFGVYSFNGNKIITTGGGGMILAKKECDIQKAKHLTTQAKSDELNFLHDEVGYNYRLTNLQAALGLAQLEQLESFINTKTENYKVYYQAVSSMDEVSILDFCHDIRSNLWFYSLFIKNPKRYPRDQVISAFHAHGIQTRPIWGLIHQQVPYLGSEEYLLEKAPFYAERVVNIPCSTNLTLEEVQRVVSVIKKIFS